MSKIKKKGGLFIKGKYHSEGGIPLVVEGLGQNIEVEKDEALIPNEAMQSKKIQKRKGTNLEILHDINKEVGAKGMNENADTVAVGDAIVCRRSLYDKKSRTYIGTDKQIVSAINQSGGCRLIERGGQAIEPDGTISQYKKGGGVDNPNARWDKKKNHIENLANNIRSLRYNLTKDLKGINEKNFLTALVISVMMKTGERVGNEESAKNGHHGVTNFKKKHISIIGNEITLNYIAKSGVEQEKSFHDKVLANYLKRAIKKSPIQFIFTTSDGFRIKADRINRYLSDFDVTAKDIRGFSSNHWIIEKLQKIRVPDSEKERKKVFNSVVKKVAEKIGHGTNTLKKHYMMPEIPDNYIYEGEIIDVKEAGVYSSGGELGISSMEKRIMNKLNDENKIGVKDLSEIIGKHPNYPREIVGGIRLEKCFLIPFYRLV